jgi:hypothetical protein
MMVAINGLNVTLVVNNKEVFQHTYEPLIVDGYAYGLNWGLVGVGSDNARGSFDNIRVQILPPQVTFDDTEDFEDGVADLFTMGTNGIWDVVNGSYSVNPGSSLGFSLLDIGPDNLNFNSYLELNAVANTQDRAGFIFDRYGDDSFKFVAIDAATDQLIIGHYTERSGWVEDATVSTLIEADTDYTLGLTLKGSTVSATLGVDGGYQAIVGHVFNASTVDGHFGLMALGGNADFDDVRVKTDDRALEVPEAALMAAQSASESTATSTLTHGQLEKIFDAAVTRWTGVGYIDQARLATLDDLELTIADMAGLTLGRSSGNRIFIDTNAAGYGWFVDETPDANEEFILSSNGWVAKPNSDAYGKIDLLTAVSHEIGHYLGLDHEDTTPDFSVMNDTLQSGYRYVGEDAILSSAFFAAGSAFLEETLTGESEDEEDASDDTPVLIFDEASGEFSESEATSDDEWYIDNGNAEPDEDVYALLSLDDEDFTQLAGLSLDDNNGRNGSRINWDGLFTG